MFLFLSLNFIFFYAAKIILLYAEPLWLSLIEKLLDIDNLDELLNR